MSNNISGDEGSFSSGAELQHQENEQQQNHIHGSTSEPSGASNSNNASTDNQQQQHPKKKRRNLPGTPDPDAEVIALSPHTLMAKNRFVCEICNKGFQRDQNLQLHRRGHNLPWKLRQRASSEVSKKRVYVCPEASCVHHNPARALGDLTGIKKHYSRKHGEKKWKCDKCSKKYAVQSDWKAHQKTCGTREYKCDCGTIFSRRDSFITHRAFCDALTEENNRVKQGLTTGNSNCTMPLSTTPNSAISEFHVPQELLPLPFKCGGMFSTTTTSLFGRPNPISPSSSSSSSALHLTSDTSSVFRAGTLSVSPHMSATALLQKAAQMGATASNNGMNSPMIQRGFVTCMAGPDHHVTRPPYDHFHSHSESNLAGISGGGAFAAQLFHKSPQEVSPLFDTNNGSTVSDMGMGMLSQMLMKNVAEEEGSDMTRVHDFLGIGGSTSRAHNSGEFHSSITNNEDWSWKPL